MAAFCAGPAFRLACVNLNNTTVQRFSHGKLLGRTSSKDLLLKRSNVQTLKYIVSVFNEAAYSLCELEAAMTYEDPCELLAVFVH